MRSFLLLDSSLTVASWEPKLKSPYTSRSPTINITHGADCKRLTGPKLGYDILSNPDWLTLGWNWLALGRPIWVPGVLSTLAQKTMSSSKRLIFSLHVDSIAIKNKWTKNTWPMITARIEKFQEELCFQITSEGPQLRIRCLFPLRFLWVSVVLVGATCAQLRVLLSALWCKCRRWTRHRPLRSSCHFSRLRRRGRSWRELLTVVSSRPSCWEMVICISLDAGACSPWRWAKGVRRWVGEHQAGFLLGIVPVLFGLLLFAFAR